MNEVLNFYCDESCHLENDASTVMTLGGVICPYFDRKMICHDIKAIKTSYGFNPNTELKWSKIDSKTADVYIALIDYFFNNPLLSFRGLIADKTHLRHQDYNQTHDDWYYKMYYLLLRYCFKKKDKFNVYIDIKDTSSSEKAEELLRICHNSKYRNPRDVIQKIQPIRSHEVEIMQLTDILVGGLCFENRIELDDFRKNPGKVKVIQHIKHRIPGQKLRFVTLNENKMNVFYWESGYAKANRM